MKHRAPRSDTLFRQFARRLMLPVLLAFALASVGTAWLSWTSEQKTLAAHRHDMLTAFSQSLIKPLWDCDDNTVQDILTTMAHQPAFRRISVVEQCRQQHLEAGTRQPSSAAVESLTLPLQYIDEHGRGFDLGELEVWIEPESMHSVLADNLLRYLTLMSVFLAMAMGAALLIFRRLISTPLQQFQAVIRQNQDRPGAEPLRAGMIIAHDNELQQVTRAYDELMQEVRLLINSLQEKQSILQNLAHTDPLTGLGNRLMLEKELPRALARSRRSGNRGCMLLLDLNHFKPVNDTWGHTVGDHVLQQVAQRLRAQLRSTDVTVRLGGDEFVVITEDLGNNGQALKSLISKLRQALEQPYLHEGQPIAIGVSIGSAFFPDDGADSKTLLDKADQAMYEQKRSR